MGLASTADDQPLRQGHPNHPKAMRVATVLTAIPLLIGALVAIGGVLLVALPTGIVAAAFSDAMQRRREAMARALEEMEGALPE